MKRIVERHRNVSAFACVEFLLLALTGCSDLPIRPDPSGEQTSPPAPLVLQSGGLYCTEPGAKLRSGALFRVCVDPDKWNRDLVVFIPGYHDPGGAPRLPDGFAETPVSLLFSELGYGFATTSFRATGLLEPDSWIGGDLLELVETARSLLRNSTGRTIRYVYQTGGSQGGLGTVKAIEQYPNTFSGGLAACGPIGDYREQIKYVADFRVVFDHLFANVIPQWPVWTQDLSVGDPGYIDPSYWPTAERNAAAALGDPSNADRVRQVLAVTHVPFDPGDQGARQATTLGILWYSFRGTNDGIAKLGGMPFGNRDRLYSGSLDDDALNAGVKRFQLTADAARLANLQTSARLRRPLVTIHGTGDPIVPVWHQAMYRRRLDFFGRWLHTPFTINNRYGHCNFTDAEVLAAFAVLVLKVSGSNLLVSSDVLPDAKAQTELLHLAQQHGASPVLTR
jgi:pimeloyl-ACP methyl ester carboxylesterase